MPIKIGSKVTATPDRQRLASYWADPVAGVDCVVVDGPVEWPQGKCWRVSPADYQGNPSGRAYWVAEEDLIAGWGARQVDNEDLRWREAARRKQDEIWRAKLAKED